MDHLLGTEDLFASAGCYGYLHPSYAEAFVEIGQVRHLRRSATWTLTRDIEGSDRRDAMVGYPRLICRDWVGLAEDLAETASLADVVTLSALTDPLATVDEEVLRPSFPDLVRVHAQHYVADLAGFWPSRDHRRAVRQALGLLDIDVEDAPADLLARWSALADVPFPGTELGLSMGACARQLALPGCVGFTAVAADGPVAVAVVYLGGEQAYLHAFAQNEVGEALGARYALVQVMVEDMAGRGLRWLDLGAAEVETAFMDGWTEHVRPSYRCGRVVDRLTYDELTRAADAVDAATFPAYRSRAARLG